MAEQNPTSSSGPTPEPGEAYLLVTIIVKPFRVEPVLRALAAFKILSLTICQVRGYGRQKGHLELYRGREYAISFIPKVKIEVVVSRSDVEELVESAEKAGRTGRIGDGKIFLTGIEAVEITG